MSCASTNTIAALLAGAADPAAAERLEVHLDYCPTCRRLVAELGRGLSAIEQPAPREALPRIGEAIGRYKLRCVVGVGGMGVVYRAHDTTLDREVAIKLLRPDLLEGPSLLAEAQAMARLQHPNIVTVHDAGIANGQLYICMEYVAGTTLRAATQGREWRDIVDMYRAAGEGLAYVHRAGLVHLDFKPDNVLIDGDGRGRVRVTDFGLARMVGNPDKRIAGTPAYMAPEQRTRGRVDARADQYAFCASLREALGNSPRLRRVLARGLAPRPADRYPDMDALLAAIVRATARRSASAAIATIAVAVAVATAMLVPHPTQVVTTTVERPRTVWRDRYQPLPASSSTTTPDPSAASTTAPAHMRAVQAMVAGLELRRARLLHVEPVGLASTSLAATTPAASDVDDADDRDDAATRCDDGSPITCTLWPPSCPSGSVLAVQAGCWTCAEPQSCMALGFPRTCNDGTPLRCAQEPTACPGRTIAAIRNGCWSCEDPFTCWSRVPEPVSPPPHAPPKEPPHPTPNGSGSNGGSNAGSGTGSDGGGSVCGNFMCEVGEDHASCASDCCETGPSGACLAVCGNGFCEPGEDHASCATDCCETTSNGACAPVCGNGFCEQGETCPSDCP